MWLLLVFLFLLLLFCCVFIFHGMLWFIFVLFCYHKDSFVYTFCLFICVLFVCCCCFTNDSCISMWFFSHVNTLFTLGNIMYFSSHMRFQGICEMALLHMWSHITHMGKMIHDHVWNVCDFTVRVYPPKSSEKKSDANERSAFA